MEIAIRNITEADVPFIYSTWLKGLRYGNETFKQMEADVFFKNYEPILDAHFKRSGFRCIVACLKDEPDVILGWAAVQYTILHFSFVKKAWRAQGIMNRMLQHSEIRSCSHLTKAGNAIRVKKGWEFNPFL